MGCRLDCCCSGSVPIYSMQTSIASLPMCASWRPNLLPPPRWFVVDAGAITHIDYTARGGLKELDEDLAQRGVMLVFTSTRA
jgi:MFS superfamily sulfate permease-like transporter